MSAAVAPAEAVAHAAAPAPALKVESTHLEATMAAYKQEKNFSTMLTHPSNQPTFHSSTPPDLNNCTRDEIQAYFENTYDIDEMLFSGISDDAFYLCPDRLRLPLIFYFAHTATVYINKMILAGLINKRVNKDLEALSETGVDEMSWDDTENFRMGGAYQWPSLDTVFEYRKIVRELIIDVIQTHPLEMPITQKSPWWSLFLGFEHERIHIETSSVLIRQLPMPFIKKPDVWVDAPVSAAEPVGDNTMVELGGEEVALGKPDDFPSFGWDNEYGSTKVFVPKFQVSKYLITNGDYLEFMQTGGYENRALWSDEGWTWKTFRNAKHPNFWVCQHSCPAIGCGDKGGLCAMTHCVPASAGSNTDDASKRRKIGSSAQFRYRTVFEVIDLPVDWPVDINYHEAKAYLKWKGDEYRLPTEAEWNLMRTPPKAGTEGTVQSEIIYNKDGGEANLNLKFGSSTPVNMFPASSAGVHDAQGNVWQWHEDHFNGLDGFKSHAYYDDFSSPCFDGRHTMILGGSWIATGDEASRFARFAFRRHFMQHAGFRFVKSTNPTPVRFTFHPQSGIEDVSHIPLVDHVPHECSANKQIAEETQADLHKQLHQTYTSDTKYYDQLAAICAQIGAQQPGPALNMGSQCGLLALKLAPHFPSILGQDTNGLYTGASAKLLEGAAVTCPCPATGAELAISAKKHIRRNSAEIVTFKQLTWLPVEVGSFDFIVADRFFERCLNQEAWGLRLQEALNRGGHLVVSTKWGEDISLFEATISKWAVKSEQTQLTMDAGFERLALGRYRLRATVAGESDVHITVWTHKCASRMRTSPPR